ncbi:MAG: hypothetical protein NTZ78_07155 [Candidatus Aureabacteria bacterium]|nr:hypothetical protein [Candidatus Auribacterota bacterium]
MRARYRRSGAWVTILLTSLCFLAQVDGLLSVAMCGPAIVIDNNNPGGGNSFVKTGTWTEATATPPFIGSNYLFAAPMSEATATWTLGSTLHGSYKVWVHYCAATNRAAAAPYTIMRGGSLPNVTVNVNQRINGGWNDIGNFTFNGHVSIQLATASSGYVIADAVGFDFTPAIVIDNSDPSFSKTGTWTTNSATQPYIGTNYLYAAASGDPAASPATATWTVGHALQGWYKVWVHYSALDNRATVAPYKITRGSSSLPSIVQLVDQKITVTYNSGWLDIGVYYFNGQASVQLSNAAPSGYVIADAVGFDDMSSTDPNTPPDIIVDNDTSHFSATPAGEWALSYATPGYYGDNYRYHASGTTDAKATWKANLPIEGQYEVYIQDCAPLPPAPNNRAQDAPYTAKHTAYNDTPPTVTVDQRTGGGLWKLIGTYYFGYGYESGVVELGTAATGATYVIADAVKFVYRGPLPLVVNEVLYNSSCGIDYQQPDGEFYEIYNRGPNPVSLTGRHWYLCNAHGVSSNADTNRKFGESLQLDDLTIQPGQYVVFTSSSSDTGDCPIPGINKEFRLANGGDWIGIGYLNSGDHLYMENFDPNRWLCPAYWGSGFMPLKPGNAVKANNDCAGGWSAIRSPDGSAANPGSDLNTSTHSPTPGASNVLSTSASAPAGLKVSVRLSQNGASNWLEVDVAAAVELKDVDIYVVGIDSREAVLSVVGYNKFIEGVAPLARSVDRIPEGSSATLISIPIAAPLSCELIVGAVPKDMPPSVESAVCYEQRTIDVR